LLGAAEIIAKGMVGEKPDIKGITEAIVGMKMPAGAQNQFLEQVFNAISSEKDADKIEIGIGKVLGDFTNRFTSPFVFKSAGEFLDLFREEGSIQRDPNVITTDNGFIEAASNRVQSKLPILKESLPEVVPRLREGPVVKEGEFFNSLVGIREIPKKTPAEQEIINVNADPFKVYGGSSGNKVYDRAFIEQVNPRAIAYVEKLIEKDTYQKLSLAEKREKIQAVLSRATEVATLQTRASFMETPEGRTMLNKMEFDKLTANERKIINERYAKENNGVTLEEANAYDKVKAYKAKLANVKN